MNRDNNVVIEDAKKHSINPFKRLKLYQIIFAAAPIMRFLQ